MDGLETDYGQQVDFVYLNAEDGGAGTQAFEAYRLRGHPAILIVLSDGLISWQGLGIAERGTVEEQVTQALSGGG